MDFAMGRPPQLGQDGFLRDPMGRLGFLGMVLTVGAVMTAVYVWQRMSKR
jgi:hypothetical protein